MLNFQSDRQNLRSEQSLQSLTEDFSHIRLALPRDNSNILEFLSQQEMKAGQIDLDFNRGEDFFAFCRLHSDNYFVFLFLNDDQTIGGLGTLLRKNRWHKGGYGPVGYLCDLRISPKASRKTHIQWRKFYAELVNYLPHGRSNEYCQDLFTAIFDDNEAALKSLTSKLKGVRYQPAGKYMSHILFMKKPFHKPKARHQITTNIPSREVAKFLEQQFAKSTWAPGFSENLGAELGLRSKEWKDWDKYPWIGLKDSNGRLIACAKTWMDPGYRRLTVRSAPKSVVRLAQSIRLFGRPKPQLNRALKVLSIPFFVVHDELSDCDKVAVAKELLAAIWKQGWHKESHFLQWSPYPEQVDLANSVTRDYFGTEKGGYLFRVTSDHSPLKPAQAPENLRAYFETSL